MQEACQGRAVNRHARSVPAHAPQHVLLGEKYFLTNMVNFSIICEQFGVSDPIKTLRSIIG